MSDCRGRTYYSGACLSLCILIVERMQNWNNIYLFLLLLLFTKTSQQQGCAKWGNTFDVSLESNNVRRECTFPDGRPICCAAVVNDTSLFIGDKGVGVSYFPSRLQQQQQQHFRHAQSAAGGSGSSKSLCSINKIYISSPQELRDLEKARQIELIPRQDPNEYFTEARLKALLDYVTSDAVTRNSTRWLERVKVHMGAASAPDIITHDDWEFLSRFEYTRTCGSEVTKWVEWIEVGFTPVRRHNCHCYKINSLKICLFYIAFVA